MSEAACVPGHVTCRSLPADLHRALGVCAIGCFQSAADHGSDGFSRLDGKTVELADGNLHTDLHGSLAMGSTWRLSSMASPRLLHAPG